MRSIAEIDRDFAGMKNNCQRQSHGCTYPTCDCLRKCNVSPATSAEAWLKNHERAHDSRWTTLEACQAANIIRDLLVAGLDAGGEASKAAQDVLAERRRQIEREGYDAAHDDDDEHDAGQIAAAAAAYATTDIGGLSNVTTRCWERTGWDWSWWRPKDQRRNLVRAAALLLAEIERLDRATPGTEGNANG